MADDITIDMLGGGKQSSIADSLLACNFDHNMLRPFLEGGKAYVNNADGKTVKQVNNATLLKDEWIHLDRAVTQVARERLNFVNDLVSSGLTYNLPNALGKTVIQYQNMGDINDASITMDGLNKTENDRAQFDITSMPIPIIHKDVFYSAREIAVSRNGGMPLDTTVLELASRKVSETAEKLHLGTYGTYSFGGGNVYGLLNFPSRNTTTYSDWAGVGKTNEQRLTDILNLMDAMRTHLRYGPFGLYLGPNLDRYLDEDFKANSDITLRERLMKIGADNNGTRKLQFIRALDYLPSDAIVLVEMKSDVIQSVVGMPTTLLQWSTDGGMKYCFKIMSIMVPRCRADYNGSCGIMHATKS